VANMMSELVVGMVHTDGVEEQEFGMNILETVLN
jgi:hypothetical protein